MENPKKVKTVVMRPWVLTICQYDNHITIEMLRSDHNQIEAHASEKGEHDDGPTARFAVDPLKQGDRVTLVRDVERFPHFVAHKGMQGTVDLVDNDTGFLSVEMDDHIDGCEEWDNCIDWSGENGFDWAPDIQPLRGRDLFEELARALRPEEIITCFATECSEDCPCPRCIKANLNILPSPAGIVLPCDNCGVSVPEEEHCGTDKSYVCPDCYNPLLEERSTSATEPSSSTS